MDIEFFRDFCLHKKNVTEEFPFDNTTLVYKVMGKMFALTNIDDFDSINLKCDPERGVELREQFEAVSPGYHMNKKHWITVRMDGSVTDRNITTWIDDSYALVVKKIGRSKRLGLNKL